MLLVFLGYAACLVGVVVAAVIAISAFIDAFEDKAPITSKRTIASAIAVVLLATLSIGSGYALYHRNDTENAAAVEVLEDRFDVTINDLGNFRTKDVTRWTVNGTERRCFVSDPGYANVGTTDLKCRNATYSSSKFYDVSDLD